MTGTFLMISRVLYSSVLVRVYAVLLTNAIAVSRQYDVYAVSISRSVELGDCLVSYSEISDSFASWFITPYPVVCPFSCMHIDPCLVPACYRDLIPVHIYQYS